MKSPLINLNVNILLCSVLGVGYESNDTSRHRISFWLSKFILLSWLHFTAKSLETCMGFTEVLEVLFPSLLACRVANKFNFVLSDRAEKSQWRLDAQKKTNNLTNLKINSTISSFFSGPLSFLIKYNLESCCFSCFLLLCFFSVLPLAVIWNYFKLKLCSVLQLFYDLMEKTTKWGKRRRERRSRRNPSSC